jgi:hypothetical protein
VLAESTSIVVVFIAKEDHTRRRAGNDNLDTGHMSRERKSSKTGMTAAQNYLGASERLGVRHGTHLHNQPSRIDAWRTPPDRINEYGPRTEVNRCIRPSGVAGTLGKERDDRAHFYRIR